ncbi:MAG: hypothetical protein ACK41W_11150, partial [Cyanobacteriota bacterium]
MTQPRPQPLTPRSSAGPAPAPGGGLVIQPLFPLALGQVWLAPDPLETAVMLREILALRGEATGNPEEGCAWTGDLHGADQLHHHPVFAPLLGRLAADGSEFVRQELFEMALRLPSSRVRESVGILEGLMGGGTHDG